MIPKTYNLLYRCIEDGINYGISRAYKHTDNPTPDTLNNEIFQAVMNEIHTWFTFEEYEHLS